MWDFQNVRFSKCAIFTKIAHFENRTFWKSHNLKISQFEKITFLLLKDWNNSFEWFFIFCRNKFQRFLKGNVSKISLKPNLEIFEKISLFKKSLKLVSIKYQISLKSLNQLLQSFNNQKVRFSKCEIFKLWDFQNVRFSKCAIFTKIAHFGENRTFFVRFSQKCAIFTIIP